MEILDALRELEHHQGKWMTVKNKKILLGETREEVQKKSGSEKVYAIQKMYHGYQAWRGEMEGMLKELINADNISKGESPTFMDESEEAIIMPLETEPLEEEAPKKSFLQRILGI